LQFNYEVGFKKGNNMPLNTVDRTIGADTLERAFKASLEVSALTGQKLIKEHRIKVAETLLKAGITLIPNDQLLDHMFVVSRGVYDAAKKII